MADTGIEVCFRLYLAGDAPNSLRARDNLERFCAAHLGGRHQIQMVDILEEPKQALENKIFLTPQLVIVSPPPVRIIIGDLSDTAAILGVLGEAGSPA